MSKDRAEPSKEKYDQSPSPHMQAMQRNYRRGPASLDPTAGTQQISNPSDCSGSNLLTHLFQSAARRLVAPPQPGHGEVAAPKPVERGRAVCNLNQLSDTESSSQTDSLCESIQSLSIHTNRPYRGRESLDRATESSCTTNGSLIKGQLTPTSDIEEQVHKALAALSPGESISAKALAKKLLQDKKTVTKALYSLERSQKASKQGLSPPEWSPYRDPNVNQNSKLENSPSQLQGSPESSQKLRAVLELKVETEENRRQLGEEDSDTASSCSSSSLLEPFDSDQKEYESLAKPKPTTEADLKEQILQLLLKLGRTAPLVIAKNLGLKTAKQVNRFLYSLEKQGEVTKKGGVAPTWELTPHCRKRMERRLRASLGTTAEGSQTEGEASGEENRGASAVLPLQGTKPLLSQLLRWHHNEEVKVQQQGSECIQIPTSRRSFTLHREPENRIEPRRASFDLKYRSNNDLTFEDSSTEEVTRLARDQNKTAGGGCQADHIDVFADFEQQRKSLPCLQIPSAEKKKLHDIQSIFSGRESEPVLVKYNVCIQTPTSRQSYTLQCKSESRLQPPILMLIFSNKICSVLRFPQQRTPCLTFEPNLLSECLMLFWKVCWMSFSN
ncbi:uncharacterized protein LOC115361772 [Myripristis murdjan]|uniref:uncharacterized protein LOC115361772 n=1 Tax=Myripristis murdjan TaxID=586833 RepID=UPI001176076D|nr:uncharacterized protein LOC115361772 [Myripristis murdjan]